MSGPAHSKSSFNQKRHSFSELMNTVETADRFLTPDDVRKINYYTDAGMVAYGLLAQKCLQLDQGYFPIRPKLHVSRPT